MTDDAKKKTTNQLFHSHPRSFEASRFIYPVLSRRSKGISIGVNISQDKTCNLNCVYCQVNRSNCLDKQLVEIDVLKSELSKTLRSVISGELFEKPKFSGVPKSLQRLNDLALSGDGEPTISKNFERVLQVCADVRQANKLSDVKLVLITNASLLHLDRVQRGLKILYENNGEIWAKLDTGTENYYRAVARSAIPFEQILKNITMAAQTHPLVIQTLFMNLRNQPPSPAEIQAYCDRINEISSAGGKIKLIQIHTVARTPAEDWVSAIPDAKLDRFTNAISQATGIEVETFYGQFAS